MQTPKTPSRGQIKFAAPAVAPTPVRERADEALRLLLQHTLVERCKRNPGYSLRAFARSMQISHTSLSLILRGARTVPAATRRRLLQHLAIGPKEWAAWEDKVEGPEAVGESAGHSFRLLAEDQFEAISEWYHFALINLVSTKNFDSDPRWIARRLGITPGEAAAASERLFRLGMLKSVDGKWTPSDSHFTNAGDDAASLRAAALRKYQKQVLEGALKAVEEIPVEQRDQSSIAMATSPERMREAIARITKFRRELCEFLEQEENKTEVYQLSISLFPLTKLETKKE